MERRHLTQIRPLLRAHKREARERKVGLSQNNRVELEMKILLWQQSYRKATDPDTIKQIEGRLSDLVAQLRQIDE